MTQAPPGGSRTHDVHRVTGSWVEAQASWNNAATGTPWTTPGGGGDYVATPTDSRDTQTQSGVWLSWDVTANVQAWWNGTATNYGFLVKDSVESATSSATDYEARFATRENGTAANQPKLIVTYIPPDLQVISMTVDGSVVNGDTVTVTMTVANNGPVEVRDVTPSALTPTPGGATETYASGPIPPFVDPLASGATATFTWTYTITGSSGWTYAFTGGASANGGAIVASSVTSNTGQVGNYGVSVSPTLVLAGSTAVQLQFTVQNGLATGTVDRVTINNPNTSIWNTDDTIMPDGRPAWAQNDISGWGAETRTAGCATGISKCYRFDDDPAVSDDIQPGGSKAFTVTFALIGNPGADLTYTLPVQVRRRNGGTTTLNVSVTVTLPNLQVTALTVDSSVVSGGTVTVSMTVKNSGATPLNNVTPSALTFIQVSGAPTASLVSGPTPTSVHPLEPDASTFFSWTYTITGSVGESFAFSGFATANGGSVTSATVTSNTGSIASYGVSVSPTSVVAGSMAVQLQFTVTNNLTSGTLDQVTVTSPNTTIWDTNNTWDDNDTDGVWTPSAPDGANGPRYRFTAPTPGGCPPTCPSDIQPNGGLNIFTVTFAQVGDPGTDTSYPFSVAIHRRGDSWTTETTLSVTVTITRYTISVTASPSAVPADGVSTSTISATLLRGGIPQSGQVISFTTAAGTLSAATATTDANGVATVTLTASVSSSNLTATVTATYLPSVTAQTTVTFEGIVLSVGASLASIGADGQSTSTVTITLTKAGVAYSGRPVTLSTTAGTLSGASFTTNASGQATASLTASVSGTDVTATLTAGYLAPTFTATTTVTFLGITFTLTPATATVDADGQSTAALTLTFRYTTGGGAISGATATVSATAGSVSPASPSSSASPIAVTYTAPASSSDSSATVTATYRGFTATSTITLRGITFTLTPTSATVDADGQSQVSLTLRFRYTSGGAITGASTTVSLSGSGTLSPTGSVSSSASDITLTYTAPASSSDGSATATVSAYKGFSALTSTITFRGITFTLSPASASVDADGQSTVALTLTFRYTSGGAITGASTTVSLSGQGSLSPTGSVSSSASDITLTYIAPASSADGTATVTAAAYKGFSAQTSTISYLGITFTLTPATATVDADGQSTVGLTLTFRYTTGGGAISGATATVSATSGSVSPTSPASSASTIAVTYTAPATSSDGTATVTATYKGFTGTSTITLRGITFTLTPATATVDADGQSTVSLTLRFRYTSGGAITGASTTVSLSGSGTLSPTGSVSSSASDITLTYTAPLSESDGNATITAAAYKGFSALASTISFRGLVLNVSASPTSIVADGVSTSTITVTFTNTVGSPVVKSVTMSTNQGSWSGGGQTTTVVTTGGSATATLVSVASKTNVTATITATYSTLPQKQTTVTFTGITINAVGYLAATAGNGQVTLYWENPTGYFTEAMVVRRAGSAPTADPVDGTSYSVGGVLADGSEVIYKGTAVTAVNPGLTNGTQYYYKAYTAYSSSSLYSTGTLLDATPTAGGVGEPKWSYNASVSGLVEPVTDGGGGIFWNNPAGGIVGASATDGSRLWPRALGGAQVEGVPTLTDIQGFSGFYAIVGTNAGTVAAVDLATGAALWQTAVLGDAIGASVGMQVWDGSDAAFQGQFGGDVLIVGTKNASPTNNKVYALDAATGTVLWTFNASGATAVDIVTGIPWVNYDGNQVLISTRSNGGSQPSLWALSTLDGSVVGTWSLGDIDNWLIWGMDGVVYVPAADGKLYALDLGTLTMKWTSPFDTGAGNPIVDYIWEDWGLQGTLFFSTQDGNVWAIQSSGGPTPPTLLWKTAVAGASAPFVFSGDGILYVGGSDGKLHQLRLTDGVDEKQQTLGDGTAAVGTPTWDWTSGWLYAGTATGKVFAIPTPLP